MTCNTEYVLLGCREVCLELSTALTNSKAVVRAAYADADEDMCNKVESALAQAARYADPDYMENMVKFQEAKLPSAPDVPAAKRLKTG